MTKKIPLGRQDAQFLLGESSETPMHVGGFNVYRLPAGARDDFVRDVVQRLREQPIASPPFNYRLAKQGALASKLAPAWEIVENENIDYHLSHHALPPPGGERELGEMLSRMHSQPLDMSRPLWEFHVIEGLSDRRFVIYQKVHHSLFDGSTGMRSFALMNSEDRDAPLRAPWAELETSEPERREKKGWLGRLTSFQSSLVKSGELYRSIPNLALATGRTLGAAVGNSSSLVAPYTSPKCVINSQVTRRRRILTQALDFDRVKSLSKTVDCTLNDVMLALVGGALRRYLKELGELPKRSLTGGLPVGLKHEAGAKAGNNVSIIFATLGTNIEDPLDRLIAVSRSTSAAKDHLMRLTDASRSAYSLMMLLPAIAGGALGSGRVMCNIPVSNVPGPRKPLYLAGAGLEAAYPTSVLTGNVALGITFVSYDRGLFVGIVACPDVLPHAQKLGPYIGDALAELEAAVAASSADKRAGAAEPVVADRPGARRVAGRQASSKRRKRTVKSSARTRPSPATRASKGSASNRHARSRAKTGRATRRR